MKDASNLNVGFSRRDSILSNFAEPDSGIIEVNISKSLYDELSNDIEKAKYLKRLGTPRNYTYVYAQPKGEKGKSDEKNNKNPTDDSKTDYSKPGIWHVSVTDRSGNEVYSIGFEQKKGDKKNALERGHSILNGKVNVDQDMRVKVYQK